jgi:hypothetical protein
VANAERDTTDEGVDVPDGQRRILVAAKAQ